jgi:hypothetical protein
VDLLCRCFRATRGARSALVLGIVITYAGNAQESGMWKSYVPQPGSLPGEFQSYDPVGLAAGALIKADCSLRWVDPATHKLYCFSSGTSLETFQDEPHLYLVRAAKEWERLHPVN